MKFKVTATIPVELEIDCQSKEEALNTPRPFSKSSVTMAITPVSLLTASRVLSYPAASR